jgi:hypothetical protein
VEQELQHKAAESLVILVRHASREKRWDTPESEHRVENKSYYPRRLSDVDSPRRLSDFETQGEPLAYALAGRLCDELKDQRQRFEVRSIIYGEHLAARQTAKIFEEVLRKRDLLKQLENTEQGHQYTDHIYFAKSGDLRGVYRQAGRPVRSRKPE